MQTEEKILVVCGLAALAAIVLFRTRDFDIAAEPDNVPITDIVGMSQTPENSDMTGGYAVYMANRRFAFWPPLDNFLPTVAGPDTGEAVTRGNDFIKRWIGMK